MMEQNQDHIATLCAAGTIGVAAAGLAFGTSSGDAFLIKPGKRKTPGGDSTRSSVPNDNILPTRRAVSQPLTPSVNLADKTQGPSTRSLFRRSTLLEPDQKSSAGSTLVPSRGSSISRHGFHRPWTRDGDTTNTPKDSTPGQSWLRRISSSIYGTSPASSVSRLESSPVGSISSRNELEKPRKLIKRSSSRHTTSLTQNQSPIPQESPIDHVQPQDLNPPNLSTSTPMSGHNWSSQPSFTRSIPLWQPFFDSSYQRKRHTSGPRETTIRTISKTYGRKPTLVLGNAVQPQDAVEGVEERHTFSSPLPAPTTDTITNRKRHKLRRSLGSVGGAKRMRTFTEPIVNTSHQQAFGSILPVTRPSPLSPVSYTSTFDIDLPPGVPSFVSSSPSMPSQHRFTINKRISVAPSDPTTISSDNDTKVFTDDDSMDFQSDTPYDSLATRATASSHSGFRQPKIETIFDDVVSEPNTAPTATIERLMLKSTLEDTAMTTLPHEIANDTANVGMGISGLEDEEMTHEHMSTPIKRGRNNSEEFMATPVPVKSRNILSELPSSPPSVFHHPAPTGDHVMVNSHDEMDVDDADNIEWSPKSDRDFGDALLRTVPMSPVLPTLASSLITSTNEDNKRSSIFDWSENQKYSGETTNGVNARPKTVHGKQSKDIARSRPAVRKAPNNKHLRSQSVPVNRDSIGDTELPPSANKFGTWGLGNKPVSEEWSDDFEFEDVDGMEGPPDLILSKDEKPGMSDTIQTVRIPQSIIDRQQSVHLQFGQVQEFMLLVEELKRLRVQGTTLDLLEGQSKQLWEDAECIINLATLNDDEEDAQRPHSPSSSDIFAEDPSPAPKSSKDMPLPAQESKSSPLTRRSIPNSVTPSIGRPRGESLAQAKSFLQTMHQTRTGSDSSPAAVRAKQREKLPFDTQDLRELVSRTAIITRALKDIVRKAEGVSVSPSKSPPRSTDPAFSQIFNPPDMSPCPPFRKPGLPKSRSANSYLDGKMSNNRNKHNNENEIPSPFTLTAVVEAN